MKHLFINEDELDDILPRIYEKCKEINASVEMNPSEHTINIISEKRVTLVTISVIELSNGYAVEDVILNQVKS
jgi:hypothetical protein